MESWSSVRPRPHRRHRHPAARQRISRSRLRRLVLAERQRRDDRHHLGRGIRLSRRPGHDHQHAQRRRGPRRRGQAPRRSFTARATGGRLPVVAETYDGCLNDINGLHVKPQNAFEALDTATSGAVPEGNVGGGTGMICFEFKGGIGTASRKLDAKAGGYTRRRPRPVQLRPPHAAAHRRRSGGREIEKQSPREQETRFHHHRHRHRRAAVAAPVEAPGTPRHHGARARR